MARKAKAAVEEDKILIENGGVDSDMTGWGASPDTKTYTAYLWTLVACPICQKQMDPLLEPGVFQCRNASCEVFKRGQALRIVDRPQAMMVEAGDLNNM